MNILSEFECDLVGLRYFSKKLAKKINIGDILLLKGELGAGKTTFSRLLINSLFDKFKIKKPETIKSPSFPIMINYPINDYEIYHYDLYRLKDESELIEINLFENLEKNISLIEWPEILLSNLNFQKYYLIKIEFIDIRKRFVKVMHSEKSIL